MEVSATSQWEPLSDDEAWTVAALAEVPPPPEFGIGPMQRGFELFGQGDVEGAAKLFESVGNLSENQVQFLNNAWYCCLWRAKRPADWSFPSGLSRGGPKNRCFDTIWALLNSWLGTRQRQWDSLRVCGELCLDADPEKLEGVVCMLILGRDGGVSSVDGVSVAVATLLNRAMIGDIGRADARRTLERDWSASRSIWAPLLDVEVPVASQQEVVPSRISGHAQDGPDDPSPEEVSGQQI